MNSGSDASKKLGALLRVGQDEFDAGKVAGEALKNAGGKEGAASIRKSETSRSISVVRRLPRGLW